MLTNDNFLTGIFELPHLDNTVLEVFLIFFPSYTKPDLIEIV
jgi:hypothetical protein